MTTTRFADAPAYLAGARALAETGRYPPRTDAYLFRPPGYAALLAAVTRGRPDRIAAAKAVNAALGAAAALMLAVLAARVFRRRDVALTAGALAAVHPTLVLAGADLHSEPLFLALLLASGWALLAAAERASAPLALAAGGMLALAALTRSSALILTPMLLAPFFGRRLPARTRAALAGGAILGFALTLSPWTLRNAIRFRELILVNDGAGYVFYGRNADTALGLAAARTREELEAASDALERERTHRIEALPPDVRDSPGRLSRALTSAALAQRRADPEGTLRLLAWKSWDWLRPYPDPRFWPAGAVILLGIYFTAITLAAAAGLARADRRGIRAFCLLYLALTFGFHVAMETSWRYRSAYWDPVLLLYAASAIAAFLSARRARPVAARG